MRMLLPLVLALLTIAGGALAQTDPDPDGVGLYFDQSATIHCQNVPVHTLFDLYLCLTNPSSPNGIGGWEAEIAVSHLGYIVRVETILPQAGYWMEPNPDSFMTAFFEPAPTSDIVVLAKTTWLLLEQIRIEFQVKPLPWNSSLPGSACYADGADPRLLIPMHPSSGSWDLPVAVINGDCDVVDTESVSWGRVKALYSATSGEVSP